jgi:hypothetical protein
VSKAIAFRNAADKIVDKNVKNIEHSIVKRIDNEVLAIIEEVAFMKQIDC